MIITVDDDIKDLMTLIDKNKMGMPEGDYLKLCNKLRDMRFGGRPYGNRFLRISIPIFRPGRFVRSQIFKNIIRAFFLTSGIIILKNKKNKKNKKIT